MTSALYLDGELQAEEVELLESHLAACETCRDTVERERHFLTTLRSAALLHTASPKLRASIEQMVANTSHTGAAPRSKPKKQRLWQSFPGLLANSWKLRAVRIALLVLASGLLIAVIWLTRNFSEPQLAATGPSSFAMMAADTHRRFLQRQLPLEIVSNRPEQISDWFIGKVNFGVKLPDYQEQSGQLKLYSLEGARLVGYREDYAAYVAYRMYQRPISLVVTSDSVARPSGGEQIVSHGLTFHFDSIHGFKVITWSDRGLTYALVSDLEERGQESCVVCHQGAQDRDLIEKLKPRR